MKYISLFVLIGLLALSCNTAKVQEDLLQFDQAYIPTFVYVYQGDMAAAKRAVLFLDKEWRKVLPQYKNHFGDNEDSRGHLQQMECWLADAYDAIEEGNQMYALNQLDQARYELYELTKAHHIDYFLDAVWEFEAILDVMVETTSDPMLCLLEWSEFLELVEDMEQSWELVLRNKLNEKQFDFDLEKMLLLYQDQLDLTEAIVDFKEAVECADAQVFVPKARAIVLPFFTYLSRFGNFAATPSNFASIQ